MKLQVIHTPEGKKWPIGHTLLVDDQDVAERLIEDGFAIVHPTVTDPAPTHPCPCQDGAEPCEECDDNHEEEVDVFEEVEDEEPSSNSNE